MVGVKKWKAAPPIPAVRAAEGRRPPRFRRHPAALFPTLFRYCDKKALPTPRRPTQSGRRSLPGSAPATPSLRRATPSPGTYLQSLKNPLQSSILR